MLTPSDQRIEEQLATLGAERCGDPPEGFIGAVRQRGRAVRTRRAVALGACALALVAIVAALPRPARETRVQPDRVAESPAAPDPGEPSMLALRRAWDTDPGSGAWLASFTTTDAAPASEADSLRLGGSLRALSEGL